MSSSSSEFHQFFARLSGLTSERYNGCRVRVLGGVVDGRQSVEIVDGPDELHGKNITVKPQHIVERQVRSLFVLFWFRLNLGCLWFADPDCVWSWTERQPEQEPGQEPQRQTRRTSQSNSFVPLTIQALSHFVCDDIVCAASSG